MLSVTKDNKRLDFIIAKGEGDIRLIESTTRQWQPGDISTPWRVPLHSWDQGLGPDRFKGRNTYAKANADASNEGILVPPPLVTSIALSEYDFDLVLSSYKMLRFTGARYTAVPYLGGVDLRDFAIFRRIGDVDYLAGRYKIFTMTVDHTLAELKDFGTNPIYDIERYQGKLYVAMGETEKIWEYDPSTVTWTQATDATYAIAFGVIDNKLWRAETTNRLSNAITAPKTLTSWVPASPNQYEVGDTSYAIKDIIDYGGVPWVKKRDGVYAPDAKAEYHNQTPQLAVWPQSCDHKDIWTAWGAVFTASPAGLLRILPGESIPVGPELSNRPDFRFHITSGVEFGGEQYLAAYDESKVSQSAIFTMKRGDEAFIYHEIVRTGLTRQTAGITVTSNTILPEIRVGVGRSLQYFNRGRGGGRHIDDPSYQFGLTWEAESGLVQPAEDLSLLTTLVGCEVVADLDSSETMELYYREGSNTIYLPLTSNQDEGGKVPITNTEGYATVLRFAPPATRGQFFSFKLTGTLDSGTGSDRPELREWYAYGYSHPRQTEVLTVIIIADSGGLRQPNVQGRSSAETLRLWREWKRDGLILPMEIKGFGEGRRTRYNIIGIEETSIQVRAGAVNGKASAVKLDLVRVDYNDLYARQ